MTRWEGKDVGMGGGKPMEADLSQVQLVSTGLRGVGVGEAFHGVRDGDGGSGVKSTVNGTVTAIVYHLFTLFYANRVFRYRPLGFILVQSPHRCLQV